MLHYVALIPLDLGKAKMAKAGDRIDVSKWSSAAVMAHEKLRHIKQVDRASDKKAEVAEVKETEKKPDESAKAEGEKGTKPKKGWFKKKVSKEPVGV